MEKRNFKVKTIGPLRRGISQRTGEEWQARDVVLEAEDNVMYPDTVAVQLSGAALERFNLKEGDVVAPVFSMRAHEHDGRWYNNVRLVECKPQQEEIRPSMRESLSPGPSMRESLSPGPSPAERGAQDNAEEEYRPFGYPD